MVIPGDIYKKVNVLVVMGKPRNNTNTHDGRMDKVVIFENGRLHNDQDDVDSKCNSMDPSK